jgi:lipopolysaccharide biosynthesis glycosyltransferase
MASDARYLPGAIGTLASARMALEPEVEVEVFFLHDGLAETEIERCRRAVSRIRGKTEICFHRIEAKFAGFPDFYFPSKMVYARLLIPEMIEADRLLYIDSDILVLKSPLRLLTETQLSTGFGAALELSAPTLADDPPRPDSQIQLDPAQPAFNSGFLLMDLPVIRASGLFRNATSLLANESSSCKWHDQSALNYSANGCFDLLEQDWNQLNHRAFFDPVEVLPSLAKRSMNVHFVTRAKPWLAWSPFPSETMFRDLLDAVDPGWRGADFTAAEAQSRRKFLLAFWLEPFFRLRAMVGKKSASDLRTAEYWGVVSADLAALRRRRTEFTKLIEGWKHEIADKLH